MAEENHTQMLLQQQQQHQQQQSQQQPTSQQQQQQPQMQQQMQPSQIQQSQIQQSQIQQSQIQQSQIQQSQIQQSQIQQQQIQQQQIQPQQIQPQQIQPQQMQPQQMQQQAQQGAAVTMSLGNSVEQQQTNPMNVSTSVPMNITPINVVSQSQMQTMSQNVNTSSVQMAVSQLAPQTVQAGTIMSQSSGPHPTMIHPTMTMAQSPLQHVQVIQQPLSTPYLQHVYTPQQQMVFPGNLTLQHAGMTTPLQNIGGAQGLSLQLQPKPTLDPKGGGQTLQAVNQANKGIVSAGTMMTGQVIGTPKSFPQQMMAAAGKSTIIHSQAGFAQSSPNQTVVIGPVGVLPNQQPIFNKALADTQKGKTYTYQPQTLQPKSLYPSPVPVHSSAQVYNGGHLKQITSQPQIITTQAPGTMFSQAQIFGSFAPLPQGLSWATTPGNFQSSLLAQNPIILRSQQSDIQYIQSQPQTAMHLPVATATAPVPATTYAATPMPTQKHKQVRVRPGMQAVATQTMVPNAITINSNTPPVRAQIKPKGKLTVTPFSNAAPPPVPPPQMATTQTQTNQSLSQTQPHSHPQPQPQPSPQPKSDAANQTIPNQVKPAVAATPEIKSPTTHSKSVGVEAKQLSPQLPAKSHAMVAPSTKIVHTTVSSTIGVSLATVASTAVTTTTTATSPVVSSTVTPVKTASVAPVMTTTSTETSTSPPPSNLLVDVDISDVDIVDSVSLLPDIPKDVPKEVAKEEVIDSKPVETEEPVVPQPIVKPLPPLPTVKEKQPQKAIVKPQVLTHVIDGFVIQEGPEPFPVSRSSLLSDPAYRVMPPEKPKRTEDYQAASPKKKLKIHSSRGNKELANCEFCGILGEKSKFKRSKRFCSLSCAKGRGPKRVRLLSTEENVAAGRKKGMRGRKGKRQISTEDMDDSAQEAKEVTTPAEEPMLVETKTVEENPVIVPEPLPAPETPAPEKMEEEVIKIESNVTQKLPTKWSVEEVFEFIKDLPGCSDYADDFRSQEIDGQALLLLKEDHLRTAMCMKLGPALKLISHINSIKEELSLLT